MPLGVPEQDIAASALPQKCLRTALGGRGVQQPVSRTLGKEGRYPPRLGAL